MGTKKYTSDDCIRLLCETYLRLKENGENRYPKRSDFSDEQVVAIKAHLGAWPRALEKSGIKPADSDKLQKQTEKKLAHKRRMTELKKR